MDMLRPLPDMGNIDVQNIYMSPIRKVVRKSPPCSRTDWDKQIEDGRERLFWDGPKPCKKLSDRPHAGDIMIFCFNGEKVILYRIKSVSDPSERLDCWSENVGHEDRPVVELVHPIEMEWDTFIGISGYEESFWCQGTQRFNKVKNQCGFERFCTYY